jgi:hypothetical protein
MSDLRAAVDASGMNLYREYGTKLLLHHLAAVDAAVEPGVSRPVAPADPLVPVAVTPAQPAAASEPPDLLDARAA